MSSFMTKQRRFSLRKLSVGLASIALASVLLSGGGVASADELSGAATRSAGATAGGATATASSAVKELTDAFGEPVSVISEDLIGGKTAGDLAEAQIGEATSKPVVDEASAKVGDVITVDKVATNPVINEAVDGAKTTTTSETKVTVTSTHKGDPTAPLGKQAPVTEVSTTSGVYETPSANITVRETLTKVTTVENLEVVDKGTTTVTQQQTADIVFIVDTSGSMHDDEIPGVIDNISKFVEQLKKDNISARIALIGYGTRFKSYDFLASEFVDGAGLFQNAFTTDSNLVIEALKKLKNDNDEREDPTKPLQAIATDARFDWSPNSSRFAIVFTDEDLDNDKDEIENQQLINDTITALKNKNIKASFVYDSENKRPPAPYYRPNQSIEAKKEFKPIADSTGGKELDIHGDYSTLFTTDLKDWVTTTVTEDTKRYHQIVTEEYTLLREVVAVAKPVPEEPAVPPVKKTEPKPTPVMTSKPKPAPAATPAPKPAASLPATGDKANLMLAGLGLLTVAASMATLALKKAND